MPRVLRDLFLWSRLVRLSRAPYLSFLRQIVTLSLLAMNAGLVALAPSLLVLLVL